MRKLALAAAVLLAVVVVAWFTLVGPRIAPREASECRVVRTETGGDFTVTYVSGSGCANG